MTNLARNALAFLRSPQRWILPLALILAGVSPAWATVGLTFRGLVQVVGTGGAITLNAPGGVVMAPDGTTYLSDTGNNRIVAITPAGSASVLAISGLGSALAGPTALALDASGNLYIADTGNSRVVKVTTAGAGSVVATGSVTLGSPQGVAVDPAGNLFIADTANGRIVEVTSGGSAAALAIAVTPGLSAPKGLAVNAAGALFIADSGNARVVTVASGSTTGTALALTVNATPATLLNPSAVALDRGGNLFIADTGRDRILEVDTLLVAQDVNTWGIGASVSGPLALAVDLTGGLHIADTGNNQVLAVALPLDGNSADTPFFASSLNRTAVNFGHVQLGAASGVTVTLPLTLAPSPAFGSLKVRTLGVENLDFTLGGTAPAAGATGAVSITVTFLPTAPGQRTGAVVLYDNAEPANAILTIPLVGFGDAPVAALSNNPASVVATGGLAMSNPYQVALDGAGNLYCGNYSGKNVTRIPAGGGTGTLVAFGTPGGTAIQNLTGVAFDGAGNLFVGDHQNSRILVVTPGGVVSVLAITGLSPALGFPTALAFDGGGNLLIADFTTGRILRVSRLQVAGSTATGMGSVVATGSYSFSSGTLTGMTVDPSGTIYGAARTQNSSSIVKVTAAGAASLLSLPGVTISNPQGVTSDAFGNIYVVDTANNRIVKLTTAGVATPLVLSGLPTPTTLGPTLFGVTLDPAGNFYIPDWTNGRIVTANVSNSVLAFASTKVGFTSTDSPRTPTVTNLGNQPLAFSAAPGYTADFSNNTSDTNPVTSSTVLAPGTAANISVNFTPKSVGSLTATLAFTDNTLNVSGSTQQVAVSGTGINPGDTTLTTVALTPSPLTNGQAVSITATVSDVTQPATVPTGVVSFTDTVGGSTTTLTGGSAVALSAGKATLSGVVLSGVGTHTIAAIYGGVTGTLLTSSGSATVVVAKAPVVLAGPATAPVTNPSTPVTFNVTATGPYANLASPTGTVTWQVLNAASAAVASGTAALAAGTSSSAASWVLDAPTLGVGVYTVSYTYGGDANYLAVTTAVTTTFTVTRVAPTVTLASSNPSGPAYLGLPLTFTATVTNTLGTTPTGTVTFLDGATVLGTAALSGGSASLTTTALTLGANSITASFAGDTWDTAGVSGALSQTISSPVVTIPTPPTPATVTNGGSASVPFTLGSLGTLGAPVTFTVTGLPEGATAAFDKNNVTVGAAPVTVNVTITTTPRLQIIGKVQDSLPVGGLGAGALLFGGIFVLPSRRRRKAGLFLSALALILVGGLTGCGGTSSAKGITTGTAGTPAGTYTVTVTATAQGAVQATTTFTLTVN